MFISKILAKSKYKTVDDNNAKVQTQNLSLLSGITQEPLIDCPIKFLLLNENKTDFNLPKNYICIVPTTSRVSKNIPYSTILDILTGFGKYNFVILGSGEAAKELSNKLNKENLSNLIDLSNKTSIKSAAKVLNGASFIVSADTGLMHLACALNKKTLANFYEKNTKSYMPDENMYDIKVLKDDTSSAEILYELENTAECKYVSKLF